MSENEAARGENTPPPSFARPTAGEDHPSMTTGNADKQLPGAHPALDRIRAILNSAGCRLHDTGSHRFQAQCPAHDDRTPSLSLTGIDGQVLLYCHAGCRTEDVLSALGLSLRDLYDSPAGIEYKYSDGRIVHRTWDERSQTFKRFRQSGVTSGSALYRADRIDGAATVYVVEGEKDVHALETLGVTAVCNPGGAGKANRADWRPLRNTNAVVVADADEAGHKHARNVAHQLDGLAASVRTVRARIGKDAADHVAAGCGVDDFQRVETPRDRKTGAELTTLSDVEPEQVSWLWPARLPVGKLVLLDGDPSLGKSTLALDFAAHVSIGKAWPDGAACPMGDVVLLSAEDGLADTIRPRLGAAGADPSRVHAFTEITELGDDGRIHARPPNLTDITKLREAVTRTQAKLLVVDVLMAYLPKDIDSHRDQDARTVLHPLKELADETGCTVLLLRHLNKSGGSHALYRGGGSIGIGGAVRAGFLVATDPDDETGKTIVFARVQGNLSEPPTNLTFRLEGTPDSHVAHVAWGKESTHALGDLLSTASSEERSERDEAVDWLKKYLTDNGSSAPSGDVIKAAGRDGISKSALTRARRRANVTTDKQGMKGPWVWKLPDSPPTKQPADEEPATPEEFSKKPKNPATRSPGSSVPSLDSWRVDRRADPGCDHCGATPSQIHHNTGRRLCRDHHPHQEEEQ